MSVTSTLDKIKDTTIMRMIRKMAGVIDEQTEAVEALNTKLDNINIEGLDVEVAKNTGDIKQLKISDAEHTEQIATIDSNVDNHAREIASLKTKDATHDTEIAELDKVTDALTKEIPNGITLYRDGTGKIKAVISQEDDTTIDSNVLDMIIPYQYDIISGTTSRSFKLDITMSDGTKYTTNDFVIPAGGGTSVTITAITLTKNADNPNRFKVSVKLDDGSTIDSGEIEMVTSVSGTFANNKLTITVNGVSSTPITIDATGTVYTAGDSVSITDGTIDVKVMSDGGLISTSNGLAVLKDYTGFVPGTDYVSLAYNDNEFGFAEGYQLLAATDTRTGVMTETDHKAFTQMKTTIGDCFNEVALGSDGKSLDFTAVDGQVNNIVLPDISNDWVDIVYDSEHPNTNINSSKIKIGTQIIAYDVTESGPSPHLRTLNITCCNIDETTFYFAGSGVYDDDTVQVVGMSFRILKSNVAKIVYWANSKEQTASFAYGVFSYAKIKY